MQIKLKICFKNLHFKLRTALLKALHKFTTNYAVTINDFNVLS